MAARLKEEFLTCFVCHEVFRNPVTLSCGHSFCSDCVTQFTKTQPTAIAQTSLSCPHCRGFTKVPDPQKPEDEWVGQLKTGFFIKDLVDTFVSEHTSGPVDSACALCQEDGETKAASVWCADCDKALCSECNKVHRKVQRGHEVSSLEGAEGKVTMRVRRRVSCPKHPESYIDMMCEDCDVAVCQRCCIIHHRKCESVITLEEALPRINKVLEKRQQHLDTRISEIQGQLDLRKSQTENLKRSGEAAEAVISKSSEKLVAVIRQQERQLKEELKKTQNEALQRLQADVKTREINLQMAQQTKGLIHEALTSDSGMESYDMYKARFDDDHIPEVEMTEVPVISVVFKHDTDRWVKNLEKDRIGEIGVIPDNHKARKIEKTSTPVLDNTLDVANVNDVFGLVVMEIDSIVAVVASFEKEKRVRSFFKQNNQDRKSELSFESNVCGIAQIADRQVAVSVKGQKQISYIQVNPDLVIDRTVNTQHEYIGLTCLSPTTLAASTFGPGCVHIIEISGVVIRSFGTDRLQCPRHLAATPGGCILVSDWGKGSLTCFTDQGEVVFHYQPPGGLALQCPYGVACSMAGDVFVVDKKAKQVIQLTKRGQYVRSVLSSHDVEMAVNIDSKNHMYVSVKGIGVQVYKFE